MSETVGNDVDKYLVVGNDIQRYYVVSTYVKSLLLYDIIDCETWYELWRGVEKNGRFGKKILGRTISQQHFPKNQHNIA